MSADLPDRIDVLSRWMQSEYYREALSPYLWETEEGVVYLFRASGLTKIGVASGGRYGAESRRKQVQWKIKTPVDLVFFRTVSFPYRLEYGLHWLFPSKNERPAKAWGTEWFRLDPEDVREIQSLIQSWDDMFPVEVPEWSAELVELWNE